MPSRDRWILFDCFNTLIDDFDPEGDETGMGVIAHVPVEAGLYASKQQFRDHYNSWRMRTWPDGGGREIAFPERMRRLFSELDGLDGRDAASVADRMTRTFLDSFSRVVRPTPGVGEMLEAWYGRARLGVVSNFHVAGLPEAYLERFGLRRYFEFVLDSAQCGWRKPRREVFFCALERAGLSEGEAGEVLYVGDGLKNDYQGARAAGLRSLYLDRSSDRPGKEPVAGLDSIGGWGEFRPDTIWGRAVGFDAR